MTIVHNDSQQSEHAHQKADARDHAHKVAAIATLAETGLREAESERVTRDRLEDGMDVLRTLLTLPWSERTLEVDRVLHTEKGDLDELRVVEYLNRLKRGESSLQARHAMVRGSAQSVIGDGWAVAQYLYAAADSLMAQEPRRQPQAPSPVHRGELPPAVPVESAPKPEQLPKRVAAPTPAEPMFPKAPPESPAEQTGVIAARAVESLREAGHATPASDAALANLTQQRGPAMTPPDPQFGAASIPGQRAVRSGDTARLPVIDDRSEAEIDEALGRLADDEPVSEPRPFSPAPVGVLGRSEPGSGGDGE